MPRTKLINLDKELMLLARSRNKSGRLTVQEKQWYAIIQTVYKSKFKERITLKPYLDLLEKKQRQKKKNSTKPSSRKDSKPQSKRHSKPTSKPQSKPQSKRHSKPTSKPQSKRDK